MVVGAFPIAKLGTLLLRQVSKPIANAAKERAKKSPFFRTFVCMPPAQFYNWCEVKAKMWILDFGQPAVVPSLNEAMAIELGANLLGEGIIFVIAAGVLYLEYMRGVRKETSKEESRKDEMDTLHYTIQELYFTTEKQDAQIRELSRLVTDLESRVVSKPWVRSSTSKSGEPDMSSSPAAAIGSNVYDDHSKHGHPQRRTGIVLQAVEELQHDIIHKR